MDRAGIWVRPMSYAPHYLIIGNGRVATHFRHYFSLLNIDFSSWHRGESEHKLNQTLSSATHVLVLITDNAIESFVKTHCEKKELIWIHFSGALVSDVVYGAHPLMTFNQETYPIDTYAKIPFVIDQDAPAYETLLPGLPNPHFYLPKNKKAKYHALCVLSANFSCMLWQKLFADFETEFNFPNDIAHPFLLQQMQNLLTDYRSALTGPLVRGDEETIEKNLSALRDDPFQSVYKAFLDCYKWC